MMPPLWQSSQVLMPIHVPAVIVLVTLVVPLPTVVIVATTIYWPVTSGVSTLRPLGPATFQIARSETLYTDTVVPSGLVVSVAADPTGALVKVQTTLVMFESGMAMLISASRYTGCLMG